MTDNEKAVMADCCKWLDEFDQPPPKSDPGCDEWWARASGALAGIGTKHRNHPLALAVAPAVMDYIEQKWHAINRKRGLE